MMKQDRSGGIQSVFKKLAPMFTPESVAVVGASDNPGKLGFFVMKSLEELGYEGVIFPINPGAEEILGYKAFSSVGRIPDPVDLVIVVVPAKYVLEVVEQCAVKKVKGIVLITSGFREIDDKAGEILQSKIAEAANRADIPIIGPNTYGFVNYHWKLNATFGPGFANRVGGIALIAGSGGMTGVFMNNLAGTRAGFSKIIGVGNRCNTDFADFLEYLIEDEETKVICSYMEGTDNPRRLVEVARDRQNDKPIVIYKSGRFSSSDRATRSHTGSLAGKHEIFEGAFRQAGILSVDSSEELADTARILSKPVMPKNNAVAILIAQAGLGIVASDVCESRGLDIPSFTGKTKEVIESLLPPMALRSNPVDLAMAWYDMKVPGRIIKAIVDDPAIGSILIAITYGGASDGMLKAISGVLLASKDKKPIVTCLLGADNANDPELAMFEEQGIMNYPNPERAAVALSNLVRHFMWKENGHC